MLLTPYYPFKELKEIEERLFSPRHTVHGDEESVAGFRPSVNTREGEYAYHIEIDVPGISKEDIKVDIKEDMLIVSGERRFKEEVKEEEYYRVESGFGSFTRRFNLPENADVENIHASAENGVLEVTIPKAPEVERVKSIEIK